MNKRTIPALAAGVVLAAGLMTACGTATNPPGSTTAPAPATTEAPTMTETATPTATETGTGTPTAEATNVVAQPSAMTLTVAGGKASGQLTVKGTSQGVPDAEVNLVFRPSGDGTPKIDSVKTDADGKFSSTEAASGSGTWTAAFMGNDSATAAAASATAG